MKKLLSFVALLLSGPVFAGVHVQQGDPITTSSVTLTGTGIRFSDNSVQTTASTGGGGGSSSLETMTNSVRVTSPTATQNYKGTSNGIGIQGVATGSTATLTFSMLPGNTNYLQSPATGTWVNTAHGAVFSTVTATSVLPSQIVYAGTNGLLSGSSGFQWSGSSVTMLSTTPGLRIDYNTSGSPNGNIIFSQQGIPQVFMSNTVTGYSVAVATYTGGATLGRLNVYNGNGSGKSQITMNESLNGFSLNDSSMTFLRPSGVNGPTLSWSNQDILQLSTGSFKAIYGVTAATVTVSTLASGQCVQTGAGGLLTVTGSPCGSGGGSGGGDNLGSHIATMTVSMPYSATISSVVVSSNAYLSNSVTSYANNGGLAVSGGLTLYDPTAGINPTWNPNGTVYNILTSSTNIAVGQVPVMSSSWTMVAGGTLVNSVSKSGSGALTGAVTFSEGSNITLTQTGNDIQIASSGGGGGGSTNGTITAASQYKLPYYSLAGTTTTISGSSIASVYPSSMTINTSTQTASQVLFDYSASSMTVSSATVNKLYLTQIQGVTPALVQGTNITITGTWPNQTINSTASGSGSGIVSPGTFTWTNTQGISVSTLAVTQTGTGSTTASVFTSTGTGNVIQVISNGVPSGGLQNATGGAINVTLNSVQDGIVIYSSVTSAQAGATMLSIKNDAPNYNDPLIWIHNVGNLSNPFMRVDDDAPDMELVNTSTDNAHGLGKFEPMAMSYQGVNLQVNSRAYDNSTFENVAYWAPLSMGGGLFIRATDLSNDSAVLTSSNTGNINFFTLNGRTVGLRAPKNPSASWTFMLPSTFSNGGQVLYQATSSGDRNWEFTAGGVAGLPLTFSGTTLAPTWNTALSISSITVSSNTYLANSTTFYNLSSPQFDFAPKLNSLTASLPLKTDANKFITASAINLSGAEATGTLAAARMPALTGSVTTSAGAVATTLSAQQSAAVTWTSSQTMTNGGGLTATYGVTAGSGTFQTRLNIPNGTNPTVSVTGDIAYDTTDGTLVAYNGQVADVIAVATNSVTVSLSSGIGWNGMSQTIWRAPTDMAITVTKIMAASLPSGTTVLFQLEERGPTTINTSGSDVFSVAYSTAHAQTVTTTSFSDAAWAAEAPIRVKMPASGASAGNPDEITFTIYYKRNRE